MDAKDLKIGEVYIFRYTKNDYIGKWKGDETCECNIIIGANSFYNHSYCNSFRVESDCIVIRLATQEEKAWLEACVAANKFIPREQIKFNIYYEIY